MGSVTINKGKGLRHIETDQIFVESPCRERVSVRAYVQAKDGIEKIEIMTLDEDEAHWLSLELIRHADEVRKNRGKP